MCVPLCAGVHDRACMWSPQEDMWCSIPLHLSPLIQHLPLNPELVALLSVGPRSLPDGVPASTDARHAWLHPAFYMGSKIIPYAYITSVLTKVSPQHTPKMILKCLALLCL